MTVDCRKWVAGLVVVLAAVAVAVASSFEPCDPSTQVYYGVTTKENDVQILCVDISNGSSRFFYDITENGLNVPYGESGQFEARDGYLFYPGQEEMGLHTVPVVFDTNNGSMSVLGLGPIDGNLVENWTDMLYDPTSKRIVASTKIFTSKTGPMTKTIFAYDSIDNAGSQYIALANVSLAFCGDCALYPFSPVSVLADGGATYISIEQELGTGVTWFMTVDLEHGNHTISPPVDNLWGLSGIALDDTDGTIYGYLCLTNGETMFNTTIVTIDPLTGVSTYLSTVDLPENQPQSATDTKMPLYMEIDIPNNRAIALYEVFDTKTMLGEMTLYTVELSTGDILHKASLDYDNLFAPWGLAVAVTSS